MHTRYRRLVNKGFTPRIIRDLEEKIVADGRRHHRLRHARRARPTSSTDIAAELPLLVIAELLGVPQEDRHNMFDWSNRMIGRDDPEYQVSRRRGPVGRGGHGALRLRRRARREASASIPTRTAHECPHPGRGGGRRTLDQLEIDLFFLLLTVAGNETTRNLISGAMNAFFEQPRPVGKLRDDRSLLPKAVEEMLRYVTPVMNFRRQRHQGHGTSAARRSEGDKVVFCHISANRDERIFDDPDRLRHHPLPQPPHRLRWRRTALLPRGQPGPHGDQGDVRATARPAPRHPPGRRGAAAAVELHQRHQAPPVAFAPSAPAALAAATRPPRRPGIEPMRFHQAVTFLPTDQLVALASGCDQGYDGIYLSDHLFNPTSPGSRYTYSTAEDGAPVVGPRTRVARPLCVISAMASRHHHRHASPPASTWPRSATSSPWPRRSAPPPCSRTTGSRLGVGVGWCKEEFEPTGQDFATRGERLDDMIPALRALWARGLGRVPRPLLRRARACQMNPSPTAPVPISGRRPLRTGLAAGGRAVRRLDRRRGLHPGRGLRRTRPTSTRQRHRAGREDEPFDIYLSLWAHPRRSTCTAASKRTGVTDMICAPWMVVPRSTAADPPDAQLRPASTPRARFAEESRGEDARDRSDTGPRPDRDHQGGCHGDS